jgi:Leucine-rich repeat (LRR) protein
LNDIQIINWLKDQCKFDYKLENETCVEISFYDESDLFGGTIRKHPLKQEIVEVVSNLTGLKHLNLRKCRVGDLPEFKTNQLIYLDISCNDLTKVPDWVLRQSELKFLSLGANQLTFVPDLDGLPLEVLKLHKNRIKQLPRLGRGIKSLNLYLNSFEEIPPLEFPLLEVFSFGVTKANRLPEFNFPFLRWLTLTVNQFEDFGSICRLSQLEGLQLAKNRIREIPDKIDSLVSLKHLTLYSNEISELPDSFFKLQLDKLNVNGNRLDQSVKSRVQDVFGNIEFLRV